MTLPQAMTPPPPPPLPPGPPPPPRGPGVRVPFLAPPRERNNTRIAVTVLVGVVLLAVCGAGALFGGAGLMDWLGKELNTKARASATAFMDAVVAGETRKAYDSTCADLRAQVSAAEFEVFWGEVAPEGSRYGLSDLETDGEYQWIPVTIQLEGGGGGKIRLYFLLEAAQNEEEQARMEVCGWEVA
ncbi:hypothetical protein Afil01_42110 [Actinorhabdospora filicis]|uniref:DUF4878 domain-containing protein n=1 Tax=Actinorhabdospora filicis TaxID=1785913 RepID=A0A9W6SP20_9ACTN|nr:hypothetical protein [Actinorhabdospora filicis]GLZ79404.1 hypothetical protein Afil01_42110 [Actinorhabdospora filicis]